MIVCCFSCRHNDLPWNVRKFVHNQILSFNFTADLEKVDPWARSNWSHTDLPRLKRGMVGAQVSTHGGRGRYQLPHCRGVLESSNRLLKGPLPSDVVRLSELRKLGPYLTETTADVHCEDHSVNSTRMLISP